MKAALLAFEGVCNAKGTECMARRNRRANLLVTFRDVNYVMIPLRHRANVRARTAVEISIVPIRPKQDLRSSAWLRTRIRPFLG